MSESPALGVMGGTFDPPHVGHRIVARDVCEALGLNRLLVVPAARPPHREAVLTAEARLRLTQAAFRGDPCVEVSAIEFESTGPSFTVDTLERLSARYPEHRLWLVIGSDQYEVMDTWHRPERIFELARLAVMRRGAGIVADPRFPFREVAVTRVDVSSTAVRQRLERGESIRYLVPDSIERDIEAAWAECRAGDRLMGHETTC